MPPVQDVATFLAMRDQGLPLLDVRSPGEFAFAHIPGALNLPLFTDEERANADVDEDPDLALLDEE